MKIYAPFRKGYEVYRGSVSKIQGSSETKVGDYVMAGGTLGLIGGGISGAVAGIATPLYVGWNLTEYLGDKIGLGPVIGTCTDIIGACLLTGVTFEVTIPILAIAGCAAGAVVGGASGGVIGGCRKGLEAVVSRSKE